MILLKPDAIPCEPLRKKKFDSGKLSERSCFVHDNYILPVIQKINPRD